MMHDSTNDLRKKVGVVAICILLIVSIVVVLFWSEENEKEKVTSFTYRLTYTLELNSSVSKEVNINWTVPNDKPNFQAVNLVNFSVSPAWIITDENNNTIANFLLRLIAGQNLNISMTALITINNTQYENSSSYPRMIVRRQSLRNIRNLSRISSRIIL